jgi:hypothetical protein
MELRQANPPKHRARLINRRQQGDLGEASAIEWLTSKGALVWLPLGHSPDVDLLADFRSGTIRVQVKTSTFLRALPGGGKRWAVALATNGGNQSWTGMTKWFDPAQADYLFVLVGDGRRWFIPTRAVEGRRGVSLGGSKYCEFEIERGTPIDPLVYGRDDPPLESPGQGEYPSGQRGGAVNAMAMPSQVRILPPPSSRQPPLHRPVPSHQNRTRTRISSQHQITIPSRPFHDAELRVGDRLQAEADGHGRVVLTRLEEQIEQQSLLGPQEGAGAA